MATNVYTAAYSTAAVRRRGLLPATGRIEESDYIGFLNDATQDYMVPVLMAAREGFLHATEDTALVADQTDYAMPRRASAERLVQVLLVDSSGGELPLERVETTRVQLENSGFELRDNTIVLHNVPNGYATLRVKYFCEPNRLVPLTECAKVMEKTATTITVDAVPDSFSTLEPLDFISGTPGFRWKALDKTPTSIASQTLTFAAGVVPSTLAAGDYLALAGETPIAQVPKSLRPLLEQRALCIALEALNDDRLGAAQKSLERMEKKLVPTLNPRVPGAPRVILNRFSPGTLRRTLPAPFGR